MSHSITGFFFRHRGRVAVAVGLAALVYLFVRGQDFLARDPQEEWLDLLGIAMAALGHLIRVVALRSIGPSSRTTVVCTDSLITDGPYSVVRNPLYLGNWLIASGLVLIAHLRWLLLIGPLGSALLYYLVVLHEEKSLRQKFGETYSAYCRAVPRFWPRALATAAGWRAFWGGQRRWEVLRSKEYWALVATGLTVILFESAEYLKNFRV